MARVNITIPDDLLAQAKAAGLNVSRLAATAVAAELQRRAKIAELDTYLADLDAEQGPISQQESVAPAASARWPVSGPVSWSYDGVSTGQRTFLRWS